MDDEELETLIQKSKRSRAFSLSDMNLDHLNSKALLEMFFLKDLDLSRNHFSSIPDVVCSLVSLEQLSFFRNEICMVSEQIRDLNGLIVLNLSSNNLESFDEVLLSLSRLEVLDLSNNQLREVPVRIGLILVVCWC